MSKESFGLPLYPSSGPGSRGGKKDFSRLPLREVGIQAGKERLEDWTGDLIIVLGLPEMTGEAVRRGHKRATDGIAAVRHDLITRKDGMVRSVKAYTLQEWEAMTARMNKIKKGAQSGFQKGVEMAATGIEFVVEGATFVLIGIGAGGETLWRVSAREVQALPKEAKAAFLDFRAELTNNKAQVLFEEAAAKRTKAQRLKIKARSHRTKSEEVRTKYKRNTKFRLK